jgi:hypothetical protein
LRVITPSVVWAVLANGLAAPAPWIAGIVCASAEPTVTVQLFDWLPSLVKFTTTE